MPVLLGEKLARYTVLGMIALMYLLVVALVVSGYFSPLLLIVLLAAHTFPTVWRMYRAPKPDSPPANYTENTWPLWFSASSFYHNRSYGLLFLAGLILSMVIR
jgi:1,4-dihydroxy-2-naphthoate octaprenyltransferase